MSCIDKEAKIKRQIELKKRSQIYRDSQKNLLNELKEILGNKDLTTNQILSLSSSIFKLNELFSKSTFVSENEKFPGIQLKDDNKSDSSVCIPNKLSFELEKTLKAYNLFGICFSESGYILYESVNPVPHFGFPDETLVGNHIKRILYDHESILDSLFNRNRPEIVCQLRRYRNSYRRMQNFSILKGRKYSTKTGAVFLGYLKHVDTIIIEPRSLFQTFEIFFWFDNSKYISCRPQSLDMLIGKECKTKDVTEDVGMRTVQRAGFAIQSLISFGKGALVLEFVCSDNSVLLVHSDNYIHPNNSNIVIGFLSPITKIPAISVEEISVSSDYLEIVNIPPDKLRHPLKERSNTDNQDKDN